MVQSSPKFLFRALRHRNYRLFFGGQAVSLIGTWMQQVAMSWLAYRLTGSPFMLGLIGFSAHIPIFLFSPFAGVCSDQWNRHRVLIATQILSLFQALTLAGLTFAGRIQPWHLIVLSFFLGLVNAFDIPARQSFVVEMIEERQDLSNAIALNSLIFNGARLVGPALAGIMIGLADEGACFLLNGISYIFIIAALRAMRVPAKTETGRQDNILRGIREGYTYAFGFAPIRYILYQLGLMSFLSMFYVVLLPVFARDILQGGPQTLGFLLAGAGIGAVTGALYLASRGTVLGLDRVIFFATMSLGAGMILFARSEIFLFSFCMMLLIGGGIMVQIAAGNTILQTLVDDDKRGRVMSLYSMAVIGMSPFGALTAGWLASKIGAPGTLALGGGACLIWALMFVRKIPEMRKFARPIYVRMGILPETPEP